MGKSVQVHKPHKTRFSSKSTRHLHRVSQTDKARVGKDQKNLKGAKAARAQHNKIMRDKKRAAIMKEKRSTGALSPRVIVLFGLSGTINISCLKNDLLALLVPEGHKEASSTVASSQYKIRVTILEAPHGDLLSCMEMAKVADLIAFVASGSTISDGLESHNFIDTFGIRCLSVLRALGLPNTAVLLRDLPVEMKRKQDMKKMFISRLGSELPEECKYYLADTKEDLHKFIWLSKEQHTSSPHWRQHRPYLLSEKVDMVPEDTNVGKCSLLLSGYVRAHNFCVNQLVHVSGAGDFQLAQIDVLKDPVPLTERKNFESMESDELYNEQVLNSLFPDSMKLQPLLVENTPDPLAGEQTWPTEADMADAEAANRLKKLKKRTLPHGTSDYQAAWIVDDTDDDNLDHDDELGDGMIIEDGQNEHTGQDAAFSDIDDESYSIKSMDAQTNADTVMMDDDDLTREQIEAEIQKIKDAHADDEEFPDEVDTPLDVPARKRFAKYRGLKSFRTSSWDPKESLPAEYAQIFAFDNFTRTQKHVLSKVAETDSGSMDEVVLVGSYVKLFVKHVPIVIASKLCALADKQPIVASGLLQHESKMSVLHFSLKKHDSYEAPIKSKETLVFHLGFRQFIARPIFSSDNLNSDKHKMERFLHTGRFSIASVYAPISFPPLPLVALKIVGGSPAIAATGSLRIVDPDRIILKKIILTGYPQRVSKLKASVRFMFHNPEDVRWFKPVELWTKCGRRGRVMEPVGTHGAMKCVFNGVVQQHDTVCMSLYKRAYPRWPEDKYAVLDQYC